MAGAGVLPETAPPANGVTPPRGPDGAAPPWVVVGPHTRAHLAALLEQSPLGRGVLVALLEGSGHADGAPYRLVLDAAHLEPEPARPG